MAKRAVSDQSVMEGLDPSAIPMPTGGLIPLNRVQSEVPVLPPQVTGTEPIMPRAAYRGRGSDIAGGVVEASEIFARAMAARRERQRWETQTKAAQDRADKQNKANAMFNMWRSDQQDAIRGSAAILAMLSDKVKSAATAKEHMREMERLGVAIRAKMRAQLADLNGQLITDSKSIGDIGMRQWSIEKGLREALKDGVSPDTVSSHRAAHADALLAKDTFTNAVIGEAALAAAMGDPSKVDVDAMTPGIIRTAFGKGTMPYEGIASVLGNPRAASDYVRDPVNKTAGVSPSDGLRVHYTTNEAYRDLVALNLAMEDEAGMASMKPEFVDTVGKIRDKFDKTMLSALKQKRDKLAPGVRQTIAGLYNRTNLTDDTALPTDVYKFAAVGALPPDLSKALRELRIEPMVPVTDKRLGAAGQMTESAQMDARAAERTSPERISNDMIAYANIDLAIRQLENPESVPEGVRDIATERLTDFKKNVAKIAAASAGRMHTQSLYLTGVDKSLFDKYVHEYMNQDDVKAEMARNPSQAALASQVKNNSKSAWLTAKKLGDKTAMQRLETQNPQAIAELQLEHTPLPEQYAARLNELRGLPPDSSYARGKTLELWREVYGKDMLDSVVQNNSPDVMKAVVDVGNGKLDPSAVPSRLPFDQVLPPGVEQSMWDSAPEIVQSLNLFNSHFKGANDELAAALNTLKTDKDKGAQAIQTFKTKYSTVNPELRKAMDEAGFKGMADYAEQTSSPMFDVIEQAYQSMNAEPPPAGVSGTDPADYLPPMEVRQREPVVETVKPGAGGETRKKDETQQ